MSKSQLICNDNFCPLNLKVGGGKYVKIWRDAIKCSFLYTYIYLLVAMTTAFDAARRGEGSAGRLQLPQREGRCFGDGPP